MKNIFYILLLLPTIIFAQYPNNSGQKITLGEQTTADGLVYRGLAADTTRKPSVDTMAYILLDTNTNIIWQYKKATNNAWTRLNLLPSDTTSFNYVNTYGPQTVNGAKTFNSAVTATRFNPTASTSTGTGMFLPSSNTLAFTTADVNRLQINAVGRVGIGTQTLTGILNIKEVGAELSIQTDNTNVYFEGINRDNTNGSVDYGFYARNGSHKFWTGVYTERMRLTNDGNVGIGTISPTARLHVKGSANASEFALKVDDSGSNNLLSVKNNGDVTLKNPLSVANGGTGNTSLDAADIVTKSGTQTIGGVKTFTSGVIGSSFIPNSSTIPTNGMYLQSTNVLAFSTNSTKAMEINTSGSVGFPTIIGTSKFTIDGNFGFAGSSGNRYLYFPETLTHSGRFILQAGPGSTAAGGALNLFGHTNNDKPGWVTVGISQGAGTGSTEGRFTVNSSALADGTDQFTVLRTGNVGIGTASPNSLLHLKSTSTFININIEGGQAGDVAWLLMSGYPNAGDFTVRESNVDNWLTIKKTSGNIGISNSSPTEKLHVVGNARITAVAALGGSSATLYRNSDGVLSTTASDINKKYNVKPIIYGLETISQLNPVNFQWNVDESEDIGFIAQDIQNIIPESIETDWESNLIFKYEKLIPILTKAIQEQNVLIKALEQRILTLENK